MNQAPWQLVFAAEADKDLQRMPPEVWARVERAVEMFSRDGSGDVRVLTDVNPKTYGLRVGEYRALFRFESVGRRAPVLVIPTVRPRGKAYRDR